jgi:AbrB family looped-hinge helix DNA binding protein
MMSTVTTRGQTAIPAAIRRRYNIKPQSRIEWIDDGHSIAVVPVSEDAVKSLRGRFRHFNLSGALAGLRREERRRGR